MFNSTVARTRASWNICSTEVSSQKPVFYIRDSFIRYITTFLKNFHNDDTDYERESNLGEDFSEYDPEGSGRAYCFIATECPVRKLPH